jgi:hypothetical protein
MEDEDYLFIKDAGDVRDLRRICTKELNALVQSMLKDYKYHQREYADGFDPAQRQKRLGPNRLQ